MLHILDKSEMTKRKKKYFIESGTHIAIKNSKNHFQEKILISISFMILVILQKPDFAVLYKLVLYVVFCILYSLRQQSDYKGLLYACLSFISAKELQEAD